MNSASNTSLYLMVSTQCLWDNTSSVIRALLLSERCSSICVYKVNLLVVYPTVSFGLLLDLGNKSSSHEGIGSTPVHFAAVF